MSTVHAMEAIVDHVTRHNDIIAVTLSRKDDQEQLEVNPTGNVIFFLSLILS